MSVTDAAPVAHPLEGDSVAAGKPQAGQDGAEKSEGHRQGAAPTVKEERQAAKRKLRTQQREAKLRAKYGPTMKPASVAVKKADGSERVVSQRHYDPDNLRRIQPHIRDEVIKRDQGICGICGSLVNKDDVLHLDHIVPVYHYGRTEASNLQVAHGPCNLRKGART